MRKIGNLKKLTTHSMGWTAVIVISFLLPQARYIMHPELNVILSTLILALVFYLNFYLLIPRFYLKRSLTIYLFSAIVLLFSAFFLFSLINYLLLDVGLLELERSPLKETRPWIPYFPYLRSIPMTVVTALALLASSLLAIQEVNRSKELEIATVKADLLNEELKMLRSQMNPHFLFNALNNIYSMVINNSMDVAPSLLRLSEMLRYVIYDIGEKEVSIRKEIDYIVNFIELHKLKDIAEDRITFNYESSETKISPMILIVFIENSFKHGRINEYAGGFVTINLKVEGYKLYFDITNTLPANHSKKKHEKGIGIENVRKRLNLIYPDRHNLIIQESEHEFYVKLEVNLVK